MPPHAAVDPGAPPTPALTAGGRRPNPVAERPCSPRVQRETRLTQARKRPEGVCARGYGGHASGGSASCTGFTDQSSPRMSCKGAGARKPRESRARARRRLSEPQERLSWGRRADPPERSSPRSSCMPMPRPERGVPPRAGTPVSPRDLRVPRRSYPQIARPRSERPSEISAVPPYQPEVDRDISAVSSRWISSRARATALIQVGGIQPS
jgi:hypothetical protein